MKQETMSLWGIGPLFGVYSGLAFVISLCLHIVSFPRFYIFQIPYVVFILISIFLLAVGSYLWITAGKQVDDHIKAGILARQGVYGIVRHPLYSGMLFAFSGLALLVRSYLLLPFPLLVYILLKMLIGREEKIIRQHFGTEYDIYKEEVNAFIPGLRGIYRAFFYPCQTQKIASDLYCIKDMDVNLFVYRKGNDFILIDTGYSEAALSQGFQQLGLKPQEVRAVLMTHSDADHCGGLALFDHAQLFLGANEEALVTHKKSRMLGLYFNKEIRRAYTLLQDGESVCLASVHVTAVATPGHTVGHTSYLIDDKYLFTGDAAILQNARLLPFYRLFNMDHRRTVLSLQKILQQRNVVLLCTGHTGTAAPADVINFRQA